MLRTASKCWNRWPGAAVAPPAVPAAEWWLLVAAVLVLALLQTIFTPAYDKATTVVDKSLEGKMSDEGEQLHDDTGSIAQSSVKGAGQAKRETSFRERPHVEAYCE